MNILRQIFFDHHNNWEKFKVKYSSRIREVVIKEVEKFRTCGNCTKLLRSGYQTSKKVL